MGKIILIGLIIAALFFFITRKISKFQFNNSTVSTSKKENIELSVPAFMLQGILRKTILTVGTGFLLLLIIIIIASKFKIALILLPISFYLIGQFFVFNNHVKIIKNQKITFNSLTNQVVITKLDGKNISFNLSTDINSIKEVKAVQKNNGILMGYFELSTKQGKYHIPYILAVNLQTKPFFDKLQYFSRESETKLFPII